MVDVKKGDKDDGVQNAFIWEENGITYAIKLVMDGYAPGPRYCRMVEFDLTARLQGPADEEGELETRFKDVAARLHTKARETAAEQDYMDVFGNVKRGHFHNPHNYGCMSTKPHFNGTMWNYLGGTFFYTGNTDHEKNPAPTDHRNKATADALSVLAAAKGVFPDELIEAARKGIELRAATPAPEHQTLWDKLYGVNYAALTR